MNRCCVLWRELTDSIEVKARDFEYALPSEKYQAQCLEKLLKYMIGNFCPTCGYQLRKTILNQKLKRRDKWI